MPGKKRASIPDTIPVDIGPKDLDKIDPGGDLAKGNLIRDRRSGSAHNSSHGS